MLEMETKTKCIRLTINHNITQGNSMVRVDRICQVCVKGEKKKNTDFEIRQS